MSLYLKNLLFTLLVPGSVAVALPLLLARGRPPATGPLGSLALLLLALGAAGYCWCLWDFATRGRGTPAPIAAPRHLVVSGPYRLTRNPMYLSVLTMILAWALRYRSAMLLGYGLLVGLVFQCFVRGVEEPRLRAQFGQEYAEYCARVGRWLPRRRPVKERR